MKLTWLGGTALRIHIGGKILVCDPQTASADVNQTELTSGADRVFARVHGAGSSDPMAWQPRRLAAMIDEDKPAEVLVHAFGMGAMLIDSVGEPPLALYGRGLMFAGRWERDAVVIVVNSFDAISALSDMKPRMLVMAFDDFSLQPAIDSLRPRLGDTALLALEQGMAVEI